jgi:hypothetical protein
VIQEQSFIPIFCGELILKLVGLDLKFAGFPLKTNTFRHHTRARYRTTKQQC